MKDIKTGVTTQSKTRQKAVKMLDDMVVV
ncbi:type II toxin-antitoxin system HicB family antitoxin [Haloarcula amylolytica]